MRHALLEGAHTLVPPLPRSAPFGSGRAGLLQCRESARPHSHTHMKARTIQVYISTEIVSTRPLAEVLNDIASEYADTIGGIRPRVEVIDSDGTRAEQDLTGGDE